MENPEKIENLNCLYSDVSNNLSAELLKHIPDAIILSAFRKQLSQLDKDIRRIKMRQDQI
jgi:archaellum component FlaC